MVTGAGGFIGSHLTAALAKAGARVTALLHYDSRPHWGNLEFLPREILERIEITGGDIADPHGVREWVKDKDIVFHLGALISIPYSYIAPAAYYQTNAMGTLNVLEACRRAGTPRIVHTSTSEVYGTAQTVPISETHPLCAQSPYAASKIAADKAAESYHRSFDLPVVTVRPFNTYGPRQSARAVVPTIVSQVLSDSADIHLGSLDPRRDLTYAPDTARGLMLAGVIPGAEGETINLGAGSDVSIGELVEMVFEAAGIRKNIICDPQRVRPAASEVMRLLSDNRKARDLLGWTPETSLPDGLRETVNFARNNPDFFKPGRYMV